MLWSWQVCGIKEFTCDALFVSNPCFNSGRILIFWAILSWAPSICAMWISHWLRLVMVLWLNDRWCRDETESLLWARTHGWAARHARVSRLIVMIHYGTTPMCCLLWIFSQSDRWILSQYVAMFYPKSIFSILSDPISWICIYLQPASFTLLHPWRSSFESRDAILFKGGRLWHPKCLFRVMSEDLS
jgi:hypothetical protein